MAEKKHYLDKDGLSYYDAAQKKRFETINSQLIEIENNGAGAPLLIVVRGSASFEGKEVTATSKLDNSTYKETITNGLALIRVKIPGEYIITNNYNDTTLTAVVGEFLEEEVYFTDYYGSINVTVPEILIGETLEAKNGETTVEKLISSTVEVLEVYKQGSWEVGIKGTEFVSKQTVELQEIGESQSCQLSVAEGVPYITVTLAPELIGETIVCKKDGFEREKLSTSETVQFFTPELGEYTISLKTSENFKETVNVDSTKEFKVTLDLEDLTVPVLIVTSKEEDNGKTIKVSRSDTVLQKVLVNKSALFVLPEQGEWSVSCDDYPDNIKKLNINANKVFKCAYRATLFGIKVTQGEADPQRRITPLEDLVGLTPITVNTQDGTVNYGDMPDYFLFQAMNHPVLKSIDKSEEIELDPYDYSQKLEGGVAPNANASSNYNMFSRVDKLYTYQYTSQGIEYYYISDEKVDDNYSAVGFTREDNSEADYTYLATYLGSYDSSNRLRSVSGVNIRNYTSYTDFAAAARKNGSGYFMEQHQQLNFFEIAFLMMFQNFNSQQALGDGRAINGGSLSDHRATQTTGFANTKGPIAYDVATQAIKFMHVEDLWFNGAYSWEEGWVTQNSSVYVRMKPPYITTESGGTSTYTQVGGAAREAGYITGSIADNKWGRVPSSVGGSDSTYECDNWSLSTNSTLYACCRGIAGLFYRANNFFSVFNYYNVARLSLLP